MPKTNINDIVSDGWRAEVSWRAEEYVCQCGTIWASRDQAPTECPECGTTASITPGHVQVASVNQRSKFEFPSQLLDHGPIGEEKWGEPEPFDGWRVTLDEAGIDRMIEALVKARNAAFPREVPKELQGCRACGRHDARVLCGSGTVLTRAQWLSHAQWVYDDSLEHGANKTNAWDHAVSKTTESYGAEPAKPQCTDSAGCPVDDHVYRESWGECERVSG